MKRKVLMAMCLSLMICFVALANNITTANVKLTGQNTGAHTTQVQFDLSWENSWRTSSGPANWDAAWVFVKYRVNNGPWKHASINATGNVAPAGSVIDIGLLTPGTAFNASTNPGLGAFIYRGANGSGTFTVTAAQLQWNYGATGVSDNDLVDVQVFGIEQVYVPTGSFYLGSGAGTSPGAEFGSFYKYPTDTDPFQITSEAQITVGATAGNLFYYNSSPGTVGDALGPVPATFPKGFRAFYCMKYELSQQGFVDFLNNLPYGQSRAHYDYNNTIGKNQFYIDTVYGSSAFQSERPYRACNFLNWADLGAYLAWAGLRPMTEMEFEKACRGVLFPLPHEYAWGTALAAKNIYTIGNPFLSNEIITAQFSAGYGVGNAYSTNTSGYFANTTTTGPARVGIFAASGTGVTGAGRASAGATYYGIMEMSGNVYERTVTAGLPAGRSFTGTHGNGTLDAGGLATNADWPSSATASGMGQRGGAFTGPVPGDSLTVSNRRFAAQVNSIRSLYCGGRGVRTAP
ncbi:MAG: SUMF1/EgtB/PvdO family nonheme iron enzyme [Bacteroidota bacterium]